MEEKKQIEVHPESGLNYYKIKLVGEEDAIIYLRLFESESPGRLKWNTDEENHDEYSIRKAYMKKLDKQRKKGQLVWNSSWGPLNQANAIRVQEEINQNKFNY